MYELALFAGAGGGLLGSRLLGWRAVCYVENNAHCVKVLKQRIADGMLDDAPIWDDVNTFDGHPWSGSVDIITAGFPCQPFSVAGNRRGADDERNGWPATIRIIREVRPRYALLENVPTLRCTVRGEPSYFGTILGDLAASRYDTRWDCIPASAIGANHQRDRIWIVATDTEGGGRAGLDLPVRPGGSYKTTADAGGPGAEMANAVYSGSSRTHGRRPRQEPENGSGAMADRDVSDANSTRLVLRQATGQQCGVCTTERSDWWDTEPAVGRVGDELAYRLDLPEASRKGVF